MITHCLLVACLVLATSGQSVPLQAAVGQNSRPATGSLDVQGAPDRCEEAGPEPSRTGTPVPDERLTSGAPAGLTLTPMAVASAEHLPSPPVRLSLARMEYSPNTGTATRRASGPLLFVVEAGTIDLYRSGERTRVGPGASALVQLDQRYALINDSGVSVTLLRLDLTPPHATDQPVLDFIDIMPTPGPALTAPTRTWLFRGDLQLLPLEPVELFVGCARWMATPGDDPTYRHAGPVGLKLFEGTVQIGEQVVLVAGGCTLFEPQEVYRLQAGDGPSRGLLFGVLPEGQSLWLPTTESATDAPDSRFEVSCGDAP